jgi:ketosteroid isomerase-like protein
MEGAASFEQAREAVLAAIESLNARDLEGARELFAEDVEYVDREGSKRGFDAIEAFWRPQFERFKIEFQAERTIDAGKGTVLLLAAVTRRAIDTDEVVLRAWPANVFRVRRDGRIVFLEGYQDRRKAFADLGLEPE